MSKGDAKICYFWYRTKGECQVFRLDVDPVFFTDFNQLTRHLANQCGLGPAPTIFTPSKQGLTQVEHIKRLEAGHQYVIVPSGITVKRAAPEFMNFEEDVAIVSYLFSFWDDMIRVIKESLQGQSVSVLFDSDGNFSTKFGEVASKFGITTKEESGSSS